MMLCCIGTHPAGTHPSKTLEACVFIGRVGSVMGTGLFDLHLQKVCLILSVFMVPWGKNIRFELKNEITQYRRTHVIFAVSQEFWKQTSFYLICYYTGNMASSLIILFTCVNKEPNLSSTMSGTFNTFVGYFG